MPLSPNLRGAVFMAISMVGFTLNDALTKLSSESINPGQIMLIRGLFACSMIGLIAWHRGALRRIGQAFHPMVAVRVMGEALATSCFLLALSHLPIANVSAVLQALPLAVTMGAAMVLGEPVGWRRWLSIAAGFGGVLIIVRPGLEGFSVYSLWALACVFFCAIRDIATKRIPQEISSFLVSTATAVVVTLTGGILVVPMGGWAPVPYSAVAMLALAAVLLVVGYQFIILSLRVGDISFVAPFRYTALIWAILLGYLIFADIPDLAMIIGSTIIVGSGIYMLYRERVVGRRPGAESTSPAMAPDGL
ncbi:DMT family transporter [Mesorhizobium australicum]|uniref:Permease of the drug/metabolite transporter (DMT) superfamily n=1 Tax=Mesorhizobium australicum TaxID=536018 RepID=A0A1X7P8R1_9HYPH|nr:DMT family transporter [Mesorhizobium australicum]SMH47387.1 Permease of the drug/metabolite transporter (DMT) superfamily [Mesorhizobium australicum]